MADYAKRWISPYFQSEEPPNFARVWVLNPGGTDVNVKAHWYHAVTGEQVELDQQAVAHGTTAIFTCGADVQFGWLRIISDEPVVPWGTTPFNPSGSQLGFAPMSFYPEEVLEL